MQLGVEQARDLRVDLGEVLIVALGAGLPGGIACHLSAAEDTIPV
jgi:hypothetical protein